jgi:hypothetical protein
LQHEGDVKENKEERVDRSVVFPDVIPNGTDEKRGDSAVEHVHGITPNGNDEKHGDCNVDRMNEGTPNGENEKREDGDVECMKEVTPHGSDEKDGDGNVDHMQEGTPNGKSEKDGDGDIECMKEVTPHGSDEKDAGGNVDRMEEGTPNGKNEPNGDNDVESCMKEVTPHGNGNVDRMKDGTPKEENGKDGNSDIEMKDRKERESDDEDWNDQDVNMVEMRVTNTPMNDNDRHGDNEKDNEKGSEKDNENKQEEVRKQGSGLSGLKRKMFEPLASDESDDGCMEAANAQEQRRKRARKEGSVEREILRQLNEISGRLGNIERGSRREEDKHWDFNLMPKLNGKPMNDDLCPNKFARDLTLKELKAVMQHFWFTETEYDRDGSRLFEVEFNHGYSESPIEKILKEADNNVETLSIQHSELKNQTQPFEN